MSFNGGYIHFEDGWGTAGTMDINRRIIASANFSGCAYKIYRTAPATYKCVHIARPSGVNADALVASVAAHATANGWTELQAVTTAGLITGTTKEIFIVSQLFLNTRIDTVRLKINNQASSSAAISTPAPPDRHLSSERSEGSSSLDPSLRSG